MDGGGFEPEEAGGTGEAGEAGAGNGKRMIGRWKRMEERHVETGSCCFNGCLVAILVAV